MEKDKSVLYVRFGIFGVVPVKLIQDKRVTHSGLRVFAILNSYQGTADDAAPTIEQIMERGKMSQKTVKTGISNLKKCGWIESCRRGFCKSNVYTCLMPVEIPEDFKDGRKNNHGNFKSGKAKNRTIQQGQNLDHPVDTDLGSTVGPKFGPSSKSKNRTIKKVQNLDHPIQKTTAKDHEERPLICTEGENPPPDPPLFQGEYSKDFIDIKKAVDAYSVIRKHQLETITDYPNKKRNVLKALQVYGDNFFKAIELYRKVLDGARNGTHYFQHVFELNAFCTRGIDKFLPDAKPLEQFKKRKKKDFIEDDMDSFIQREAE